MTTLLWATLLLLTPEDPEWLVVLRNGHEQRAAAVEESAETVRLHFSVGTMEIAASDVAYVQKVTAEAAPTPLVSEAPTEFRFSLGQRSFRARIPAGFESSESSERFLRLEQPRTYRVVRVLQDEQGLQLTPTTLWQQLAAIRTHHVETYDDYHVIRERFSLTDDQQSWLLVFTCQRRETTWKECRGFFIIGDQVVVVTATAPSADQDFDPQQTVQAIGASLTQSDK